MEFLEDVISGLVLIMCMIGAVALPVLLVLAFAGVVSW